jgi:hypothetical protein
MVSPNLFLKLNISFSAILGLFIIYSNVSNSRCTLYENVIGLFFVFYAVNNIIILKQRSSPQLKKDILRINTLFYICLLLFLLIEFNSSKPNKHLYICTMISLAFVGLIINYVGHKITKNVVN